MTAAREAVHREPAWRERSNFIIASAIDAANTDMTTEQLWARKIDDRHFEICCIPFFAYNVALGGTWWRQTVTSWPGECPPVRAGTCSGSTSAGPLIHVKRSPSNWSRWARLLEWSSANLLAVDAGDQAHAQVVCGLPAGARGARSVAV